MNETFPHAVHRRWRNIRNATKGIHEYTDEHGQIHRGTDVATYLDTTTAAAGPLEPAWLERLMQHLEKQAGL